ncbi:MAG: hypothetical protein SFX19_06830 [Alphaproteobacteria bacterium]|nr:hypothetical protein [Alphaproteobacteria bacterium]
MSHKKFVLALYLSTAISSAAFASAPISPPAQPPLGTSAGCFADANQAQADETQMCVDIYITFNNGDASVPNDPEGYETCTRQAYEAYQARMNICQTIAQSEMFWEDIQRQMAEAEERARQALQALEESRPIMPEFAGETDEDQEWQETVDEWNFDNDGTESGWISPFDPVATPTAMPEPNPTATPTATPAPIDPYNDGSCGTGLAGIYPECYPLEPTPTPSYGSNPTPTPVPTPTPSVSGPADPNAMSFQPSSSPETGSSMLAEGAPTDAADVIITPLAFPTPPVETGASYAPAAPVETSSSMLAEDAPADATDVVITPFAYPTNPVETGSSMLAEGAPANAADVIITPPAFPESPVINQTAYNVAAPVESSADILAPEAVDYAAMAMPAMPIPAVPAPDMYAAMATANPFIPAPTSLGTEGLLPEDPAEKPQCAEWKANVTSNVQLAPEVTDEAVQKATQSVAKHPELRIVYFKVNGELRVTFEGIENDAATQGLCTM